MKISAILLAGGRGERMGRPIPKQFLPLSNKAIALHSLEVLQQLKEIGEIIVVCAPEYRHFFDSHAVKFALPGEQRQDSVYNGLQMISSEAEWVCTHDSARPFITLQMVKTLFQAAATVGAASLAMPVKNTLKATTPLHQVASTLDRSLIWEIQTPQVIKKEALLAGFAYARARALAVTDDVSLAELIGQPVQLVSGGYQNIKITTPEDLSFAEWWTQKNIECASPTMEQAIAAGKSSPMASPSKD